MYIYTYRTRAHTYMHTYREIVTHTYMSLHICMREHAPILVVLMYRYS